MTPDTAYRVGEPMPNGRPRRSGLWQIGSTLPETAIFAEHLDALIERLRPAWPALVELGRRHEAWVEGAIEMNVGPEVSISPAAIAALVQLNAHVGFDLYQAAHDALPRDEQ